MAGDGQVALSWTNPAEVDFAGVKICQDTVTYPTDPTTCNPVYEGTGTNHADTGLDNGTTYYYIAFAHDEVPNYSSGAQASAAPTAIWTTVTTGAFHTLALRADGTLWAWGRNDDGQHGLGDTIERHSPTQVGTATDWSAVAGGFHTMALRADGTLWAWGDNSLGGLGVGTSTGPQMCPGGNACSTIPAQVGTASNWSAVATGSFHTVALCSDGALWAWGYNLFGQLGLGDTNDRNTPTRVEL